MKRLCALIVVAAFVAVGCNKAEEPAAPAPKAYGNLAQVMRPYRSGRQTSPSMRRMPTLV
jgi:hypothetical protein